MSYAASWRRPPGRSPNTPHEWERNRPPGVDVRRPRPPAGGARHPRRELAARDRSAAQLAARDRSQVIPDVVRRQLAGPRDDPRTRRTSGNETGPRASSYADLVPQLAARDTPAPQLAARDTPRRATGGARQVAGHPRCRTPPVSGPPRRSPPTPRNWRRATPPPRNWRRATRRRSSPMSYAASWRAPRRQGPRETVAPGDRAPGRADAREAGPRESSPGRAARGPSPQPNARTMSSTRSLASPKSMRELSLKNSGFCTPA